MHRMCSAIEQGLWALQRNLTAMFNILNESTDLRKHIGDLDNQTTRIETILEQQPGHDGARYALILLEPLETPVS